MKIAHGELSAICRAVGVMQPKDSIELHNLPLLVTPDLPKAATTVSPSRASPFVRGSKQANRRNIQTHRDRST